LDPLFPDFTLKLPLRFPIKMRMNSSMMALTMIPAHAGYTLNPANKFPKTKPMLAAVAAYLK